MGCYKKGKENTREKEFQEQGPTQTALQGPDVGSAQIFVTDSNCWRSLQREKEVQPLPLYEALSENLREINEKNGKS